LAQACEVRSIGLDAAQDAHTGAYILIGQSRVRGRMARGGMGVHPPIVKPAALRRRLQRQAIAYKNSTNDAVAPSNPLILGFFESIK